MTPKPLSLLVAFALFFSFGNAQVPAGAFSFHCKRDTLIGCGPACVTLTAQIPNIGSSAESYTVAKISGSPDGCFAPYVAPGSGGFPLLATDDRYSPLVTLPFAFPFFGNYYSQLTVSGNGYVSFDNATASMFSHYGMLNSGGGLTSITGTPVNFPSTLYDRALIMVPYHDMDITLPSSPNRKIKMEIIGTAPHRKWILSFYKIPLYTCDAFIENTSQLVLYESTGIVEVFVYSNQVCTGWNQGRSMIGMQNYDRDKGIMAPGRAASDAPWGTVNMNEAWRFTPAAGPTLLKKTELYKLNGEFVTNADTVNTGNGQYNVYFSNVCIGDSGNTFIVKSTYNKFDDYNTEVYATDTIQVTRQSLPTPTVSVAGACGGSEGSITVAAPSGAGFTYSLNDGATFQTSSVFANLSAGTYVLTVKDNNGCMSSLAVVVPPDGQFNTVVTYPGHAVCQTGTVNISPTVNGISGGKFTAVPAGLAIDSISGEINVAGSDTGLYQITYHLENAAPCVAPTSTTSIRVVDSSQFVWTGAIDEAWENADNWTCNHLPNSSSNVIIEQGNVIVSSNITVNSLFVMPGANITVAPGFNITVLH